MDVGERVSCEEARGSRDLTAIIHDAGVLGKAVMGNAEAVSVRLQGQPVDLTPYVRANVVRFAVSSEGSLQPVDR